MFKLDGRVALVTGAAGYLGRAMAMSLGRCGALVVLNGRRSAPLAHLESEMRAVGLGARALPFDVTDAPATEAAIRQVERDHGMLDIVVNNANPGRASTIETATPECFAEAWDVTVVAAFRIVQLARPLLKRSGALRPGGASVINIASMYGVVSPDPSVYGTSGSNNPPFYGPAKAGLIQLTRYLACHLAADRIRVNAISPGPFPSSEAVNQTPAFVAALERKVPLGRIGTPDEVAGPLIFLASDAASYVTGANLAVDGGWTAW